MKTALDKPTAHWVTTRGCALIITSPVGVRERSEEWAEYGIQVPLESGDAAADEDEDECHGCVLHIMHMGVPGRSKHE